MRDVLGAALGRRRVPPARHAHGVARRLRAVRRALGVVPDPDRAGVLHVARASAGGVVALYPSPAGATESELDLEAWDALCAANPVLETLEPDAEALIVNRLATPPQHAIVPIDVAYRLVGLVKARWEGISGGAATEAAVAEYFAGLRGAARGADERAAIRAFEVLGVEPVAHAAAPTLRFPLHVDRAARRAVHAIALSTQIHIDPARRAYDDETRAAARRAVRARPSAGRATTRSFRGRSVDALVPGFTGATSFALDVPCTYDLEVAAAKYFYSLPDGEVPLTFHFTGTILYRGGRPAAGRDGAVELLGALQAAGRGLEAR